MACNRDLHNSVKISTIEVPGTYTNRGTTAWVSEIVDTAGYDSLEFFIALGEMTDADAVYSVLVEDGDDSGLSDNAAVADDFLLGTENGAAFDYTAANNEGRKIGYIGKKRYVRLTITPTTSANSGDSPLAVIAIQGHARHDPQSSQS